MNLLPTLPQPKRALLEQLVARLSGIPGMAAIVLGGSYASGTHHQNSDLDLGLYYHEASPFSIDDIRRIAEAASTERPATVTGFYGWGAWVNGGAWIHTPHGKVDFLYRSLEHVQRTISEAGQGISHHDYEQQPTYGFYSVIYLAETRICIPLYDPERLISGLKRQVETYPPRLKQAIISDSLWAVEFTLLYARSFAAQGDIYNTAGCLARAASSLMQALFALNESYFIRDKQVMETISAFPLLPVSYIQQVERLLACPGSSAQELAETVGNLEQLWRSVLSLPGVRYEPKFQV